MEAKAASVGIRIGQGYCLSLRFLAFFAANLVLQVQRD
jgi:hypothetical protein